MKICLVNCVYKYGSTGKIVADLATTFKSLNNETIVLYGRGLLPNDSNSIKVSSEFEAKIHSLLSRLTGIMYGFSYFSTNKIINIIKKEKPNIVNLHCINGNFINVYKIITWLKKNNIPTVITNHAEFLYTGNCGIAKECTKYMSGCGNCPRLKEETNSLFFDNTNKSWKKMKKAFEGFNNLRIINVSPWLKDKASKSIIQGNFKHYVVLNGLDSKIFHYVPCNKNGQKIILHATPYFTDDENDLKGGRYIIELAKRLKHKNVKFVVAGKYDKNVKVGSNIELLGEIKDQNELAKLYSRADLYLLTSKRETFSMTTAESLSCGTPVVGFKAGGPEAIALKEYSNFVEYGDVDALEKTIISFLNKDFDKEFISKEALSKYSKERMANEYLNVYKETLDNWRY